jgi:hypothetical protein
LHWKIHGTGKSGKQKRRRGQATTPMKVSFKDTEGVGEMAEAQIPWLAPG